MLGLLLLLIIVDLGGGSEAGVELLDEKGNDLVQVRLHAGDRGRGPVLGHGLLHTAVLGRAHLAKDVVLGLAADLEAADGVPVGL